MLGNVQGLELVNHEQGSKEWFLARSGSLGSSEYKTAVASGLGGGPSKTRQDMLERKVRETYTGEPETWGENAATRWGHRYEEEALGYFEDITGLIVSTAGMVRNTNYPGAHTSPDGLIFTPDGVYVLEIKCPQWSTYCKYLQQATCRSWLYPAEYRLQIRHHQVILGAEQGYCLGAFFLCYYPETEAVERGYIEDGESVVQILRYIPPPSIEEIAEHSAGIERFHVDYEALLPRAGQLVAEHCRRKYIDRQKYIAACRSNDQINKELIGKIS